jgi:type II secretory pathway component PulK
MKIALFKRRKQNGSAVVVVIALLFVLVSIMAINQQALFQLHRQIETIEQRQLKKYGANAVAKVSSKQTNSTSRTEK